MLEQVEEGSSPHWMSSKTTMSGRRPRLARAVLRNAQAISSAEVAASASRAASERRGSGLVRGHEVELLQHLHDRPVGDPSP